MLPMPPMRRSSFASSCASQGIRGGAPFSGGLLARQDKASGTRASELHEAEPRGTGVLVICGPGRVLLGRHTSTSANDRPTPRSPSESRWSATHRSGRLCKPAPVGAKLPRTGNLFPTGQPLLSVDEAGQFYFVLRRRFDSRYGRSGKIGGTTLKIRLGIQWNVSAKWDSLCA
jgi:hypothetical protein